ncbi:hypothetical protein BT93_L4631 [Corymbia citriodora subsp. variegata]|uniref:Transcription factor CBF/NF-Y/archaeal histone domain-containing protein n=1 Tax=Corymbia citriodora subsp. variegata TaxID=360336 RepID=A0A8T0CHT7_CORYI|nr:hypothetical protein BT93_L4631 [Corymbia citriodora subsp. variegata]
MPYNTNAIPRPEEVTGTSALPLARVKKIIAQDEDVAQCSNAAAFAISIATEEFVRYLTEQAFNVAKSEAKPRRTIAYKDVAAAVAKFDSLQFLSDTVPRTVTYKQVKEKKLPEQKRETNGTAEEDNKQKSITSMMQPNANGFPIRQSTPPFRDHSMANSPILDRTQMPPDQSRPINQDIDMQD